MPRVNLEGATLKGCTMDKRMGIHTNLEGTYTSIHTYMCTGGRDVPGLLWYRYHNHYVIVYARYMYVSEHNEPAK